MIEDGMTLNVVTLLQVCALQIATTLGPALLHHWLIHVLSRKTNVREIIGADYH
jgi:hypothetical protein